MPSPRGTGGDGLLGLLSSLFFILAVVAWLVQVSHQHGARPTVLTAYQFERRRKAAAYRASQAERHRRWQEKADRWRDVIRRATRYVVSFQWYRDLPDWAQAVALGLTFAAPVVVMIVVVVGGRPHPAPGRTAESATKNSPPVHQTPIRIVPPPPF